MITITFTCDTCEYKWTYTAKSNHEVLPVQKYNELCSTCMENAVKAFKQVKRGRPANCICPRYVHYKDCPAVGE